MYNIIAYHSIDTSIMGHAPFLFGFLYITNRKKRNSIAYLHGEEILNIIICKYIYFYFFS